MQTLYAVLTVTALSVAVVKLVTENPERLALLQRKPFTCVYCMTWWLAAAISLVIFPTHPYFMIPVVQILAYIVYQKLL
jgi:hypothetical protein